MKNNITEVVFILDASGSMHEMTKDTIGGFNSMLARQKEKDGKVLISTVLFNNESTVIHDRVDLRKVKDLSEKEYCAGGSTALIDALGGAIKHISTIHKYARPEDVPENTLFVITTDGMENSSHKYSSDQVKKMVSEKRELGWEFIFMGANIDAVETAQVYGIAPERAVDYHCDAKGTGAIWGAVTKSMNQMRFCSAVSDDWSEAIMEDNESRK